MKRVLCLFVAFVLSSSVAFSQNDSTANGSTVDTQSFFDYLIKKKSVSIEYRQYEISKVNNEKKFSGFFGMPQTRLDLKADLFGGVLVGGIYVQTSFMDNRVESAPNGSVWTSSDVIEFSLTSPYTSFESNYFDAAFTLSWTPAMKNKYGLNYESLNGKIESTVKAPVFNVGIGSLALSSGVEFVAHYTPYDKDVKAKMEAAPKDPSPAYAAVGTSEEEVTTKTDKQNVDLTVTVLDAKLPLNAVKGLALSSKIEYESNYVAAASIKVDGSKNEYYDISRETRTTLGVGYALTPNVSVSESVTYTMDGFYKNSIDAKRWTNLVAIKYSL